MSKMNYFKNILIATLASSLPFLCYSQNATSTFEENFKEETLQLAQEWIKAWSGQVDINHLMSLHHPKLQYYWRANPNDYEEFKSLLPHIIDTDSEPWNGKLVNPNITIIDNNNAVIGFQMMGADANYDAGDYAAVSLVITRTQNGLKIIHIHESGPE